MSLLGSIIESAKALFYNNGTSGATATNVQDAIDEVFSVASNPPVYTIDIVANELKLYKDAVEVGSEDLSLILSDADIKTKYENNANTNAFTDAEKTNLSNQSGTNTGDEVQATESVSGIGEIATQTETDAGTNDTNFITPLKLANYSGLATTKETFYLERIEQINRTSNSYIEYFTTAQNGTEISNVVSAIGGTYELTINAVVRNTSSAGWIQIRPQINNSSIFVQPYKYEPDDGQNIDYLSVSKRVNLNAGNNTIDLDFLNIDNGTAIIYEANITLKQV